MAEQDSFFLSNEAWCKELTKAFIKCGVPFNTLDKKPFKEVFQKHHGINLPSGSNLRKTYLNKVYHDDMIKLRLKINGLKTYIMLDETQINK